MTLFLALCVTLGGIGILCIICGIQKKLPDDPTQGILPISALQEAVRFLEMVIVFAVVVRFVARTFLFDLTFIIPFQNMDNVHTDTSVFHLTYYDLPYFSDGDPYGLIECDARDIVCKQIESIVVVPLVDDKGPEQPTLKDNNASETLYIAVKIGDYDKDQLTLRHNDITHTLYVEGNGQTYYSYQRGQ
ncbi:MAG: hypothetical protein JXB30_12135 [Anaerolineae bacterium]|nr:hypothetical protein [Anaerolineae bacterium]